MWCSKFRRADNVTGENAYVYARTTDYAIAFAHRQIAPCSFAHVAIGDVIVGVLEAPRSEQRPTNFPAWRVPKLGDVIRPNGPQVPHWYEVVLEPDVVAGMPQLGGLNFWHGPPNTALVSLRLELPTTDINVFKEECNNPWILAPATPPPRMKGGGGGAFRQTPQPFVERRRSYPPSRKRKRCRPALFGATQPTWRFPDG